MPEQNKESPEIQIKPKSTLGFPQNPQEESRTKFSGEILTQKEPATNENQPTEYLGGTQETQEEETKTLTKIQEEIAKKEKVETVRDLRALDVDTLIKLEDKFEGILLYAFTDTIDGSKKIDFENWKEYKEPTQGTKIKINFRGNPEAEMKVGACDVFPPSVRKITVYSHGDKNTYRTSERRIGLKGRNVDGTGFFDSDGYIPIFTGDVVEIGGIDKEFDKKYRNEKGEIDESSYQKYSTENESEETKYREEIFKKNPAAQRNKIMTPEEIDALSQQIEASGLGKKVIKSAFDRVNSGEPNRSCWTVCEQIYQRAGARRRSVYHYPPYNGPDCGNCHAGPELVNRIAPGDWIFINVKARDPKTGIPYDKHGNHSVIFLRWLDKENQIAQVISGGGKTKPRVHKSDLKKSPVTYIAKPA
jgi:hypothetical protein